MNAHTALFPHVRVSTSPETGTDGHTLSGLHEIPGANFYLYEETIQGFYRTDLEEPERYLPQGIYYWQMESGRYQTQIYSFVVTPKPPTAQQSPNPTFSNSPGLASPETERQTPLRCHRGYTKAHIGGKAKCLHSGQSCSWRYRQQYRRYHFACVRKGRHFRLVRRH
jgi:hypothetical protein